MLVCVCACVCVCGCVCVCVCVLSGQKERAVRWRGIYQHCGVTPDLTLPWLCLDRWIIAAPLTSDKCVCSMWAYVCVCVCCVYVSIWRIQSQHLFGSLFIMYSAIYPPQSPPQTKSIVVLIWSSLHSLLQEEFNWLVSWHLSSSYPICVCVCVCVCVFVHCLHATELVIIYFYIFLHGLCIYIIIPRLSNNMQGLKVGFVQTSKLQFKTFKMTEPAYKCIKLNYLGNPNKM